MGFDVENFGLGMLAGWASAYGVYRFRRQINGVYLSLRGGAATAGQSATRTSDARYINDVIDMAESAHLGGLNIPLSAVLVEPRFIPAPSLTRPPDDETIHDIFHVLPTIHDHPFMHAPYNLETLSIAELGAGDNALALLGEPGSGRTTALMAMALYSLNKVDFKPPADKIQAKMDSEEAALNEKERAVRVKERITIEQRAKERLANEQGNDFDATADAATQAAVPLFRRVMPIYVHFADLLAANSELGKEIDPAEPIVRAVQYNVKRVTSSTIPRAVYKRLSQGTCLVLIDGYDDLPPGDQQRAIVWLAAFKKQYGANFIVVAAPVVGAGDVLQHGFTPVYLRPWNDNDLVTSVQKWKDAWSAFNGRKSKKKAETAAAQALERALANNRALFPVENVIKTWANLEDSVERPGYEGWMRNALARLLPKDQPLETTISRLSRLATLQLDDGFITAARMQTLAISGIAAPAPAAEADDAAEPEPTKGKKGKKGEGAAEDSETASEQGRLLASLRKSGLLVRYRGDRYQFRHLFLASYAASLWLKTATKEDQNQRAVLTSWRQAFAYLGLHGDVETLVRKRLSAPSDVLGISVLDTARWMAYAPMDASWRGDVMRQLSNQLIAPNQYPLARERAAAALISTRDKSALLVFRRAVRNINPDIRRLACLGMGALGDEEALKDLKPLMNDQNADVQLAAGMALGAIGTDEALETMVISFTQGSEQLRQAMAEAFAALPEEGYPILFDAISHEDMMLRRAAVFGLRRLRTTWSLIEIYRAFLEDEQWYVRSAAQQAFQELQYGRDVALTAPLPSADQIEWLAKWASSQGENIPSGDAAVQLLIRALQEGDPALRALAAENLGQLGAVSAVKPLYAALRDRHEPVRAAAHRSLALIEAYSGEALPSPA